MEFIWKALTLYLVEPATNDGYISGTLGASPRDVDGLVTQKRITVPVFPAVTDAMWNVNSWFDSEGMCAAKPPTSLSGPASRAFATTAAPAADCREDAALESKEDGLDGDELEACDGWASVLVVTDADGTDAGSSLPPHAVRPPAAHASAVAINTYLRMVILSPP
ncbi:hypothetical protein KJZ00_03485 [Cutibacterium avidum]|uniref:hypothetical protein n=1 Tax=Cutibacterium avidum TaxID=33010 RepID=UPI0009243408|nr:hypothetical protein [Cutibacterium avidum]MCO6631246.1 hypothetical protein [Cutibacterium avidum]MCO6659831.1 hypothetical protein [Cutibacterium avidum]MCO6664497.1 hypothetical protein [Cutibacterium avidum]MCT1416604.1 hypothetical protein [Cutibacterium avidum]MCX8467943.1 hypothetical protein [Cutibacterium avidum]